MSKPLCSAIRPLRFREMFSERADLMVLRPADQYGMKHGYYRDADAIVMVEAEYHVWVSREDNLAVHPLDPRTSKLLARSVLTEALDE